ncbi:hypothetical protein Scep_019412 [Stephania cephalantha]|uniref:Uncharacterized protein n=1 Tax=Stephania cephalantha TaxID=152367 RepID=A0AAP0NM44_9MAGN
MVLIELYVLRGIALGIPLGGHRPVGRGAAPTSGCEIPTGRHGQATRGVHRGRGGRGRGSIPALSIPTSRSLEHDPAAASHSPSIPSASSVPSSSSSRTIPNSQFQSPSPTSRTPLPTRPDRFIRDATYVNELYLHLHTVNHDGMTFIDTRSERFYVSSEMRRREATRATRTNRWMMRRCTSRRRVSVPKDVSTVSGL